MRKWSVAIATLLAVSSASVVLAQGPGMRDRERGMGYGWGPGMGWHMGGGWGPRWSADDIMSERVDGRLAFLKTELKISDAQMSAWNKLADVIRTAAKARTERMRSILSGDQRDKALPQRLDEQEKYLSTRLDEVRQIRAAWDELYQSLSDAQKKEADNIALPMMGMGGPRMGMRF